MDALTALVIFLVMTATNAFNQGIKNHSQPYWNKNYFIEAELPKELRGKPIQYIDSVFQAKRKSTSSLQEEQQEPNPL